MEVLFSKNTRPRNVGIDFEKCFLSFYVGLFMMNLRKKWIHCSAVGVRILIFGNYSLSWACKYFEFEVSLLQ